MNRGGRKKRIAVIGLKGLPASGGAARSMENIVRLLKNDYDFVVYAVASHASSQGIHDGYSQIVFNGCRHKLFNTFIYYWKSMFHCLFCSRYDLVHMNHAESGFVVPFLKLRYNVITTFHGVYTDERFEDKFSRTSNYLFRVFQKISLLFSNVIVSVSRYEIPFCLMRTRRPVIHIPNGVDVHGYPALKDAPFGDYLLFAAARIYGVKGCDLMLRALIKMDYKGKVIILGDLEHDPDHKRLLKDLSAKLDVRFKGLIRDKSVLMRYLKGAKVFVFPSVIEGMSNMLLEAASVGTPLVCSRIAANVDIFSEDDVTFFNSRDAADLSHKIKQVLENPGEAKEKARRAHEKLLTSFTWELAAERYKNVYESLLSVPNRH